MTLSYVLSTDPDPLQPSPSEGELARCDLRLTVTNPTSAPVYCTGISILLPVGPLGVQLATTGLGITGVAAPATWTVAAPQEDVLIIVPQDGAARFTENPHGNRETVTPALTVWLRQIRVNRRVGSADVIIRETVSATTHGPWTENSGTCEVTKFSARAATTS
ncbi:hypothetical protein [Amycolatopsis panacis]|nr:hypothetical protein [Amycolatopsis panacis]